MSVICNLGPSNVCIRYNILISGTYKGCAPEHEDEALAYVEELRSRLEDIETWKNKGYSYNKRCNYYGDRTEVNCRIEIFECTDDATDKVTDFSYTAYSKYDAQARIVGILRTDNKAYFTDVC